MNRWLKIDSIMFFVRDLDASAKFYERVLEIRRVWTDKKREMIGLIFLKANLKLLSTMTQRFRTRILASWWKTLKISAWSFANRAIKFCTNHLRYDAVSLPFSLTLMIIKYRSLI